VYSGKDDLGSEMKSIIAIILFLISFFDLSPESFAAESTGSRGEWEKAVEAAKKEGQLTIYHWGSPLILEAGIFQKAHPEIKLTTVTGIGTQLMQRIMAERRGEKFIPDIYIAGIATMTLLNQAKTFDAIKPALMLPEVIDESRWWKGKHLYGDLERTNIVTFVKNPDYGSIAINTKLVDPKEFRSYWDFLQPKWKSKITVQDLRGGGPGTTPLRFMYYNPDLGPKFVRQLYSGMDATLYRDNRLALDWIGSGKFAIAFYVQKVEEAEEKGLSVQQLKQSLKEGVGLSSSVGHIALLNRAPHPNAARVFINWFLSREAQDAHQRISVDHKGPVDSLRIDIPKDYIPLSDRRQNGVKYMDLDDQKVSDPNPPLQLIKDTLADIGK
jgi:iron(III) transport system substrate-binding protein